MVDIDIVYEGGLRCRAVHRPSQNELLTDAPVDNHGRGEAFSPTDLIATGLGTCMATTMGIVAQKRGLPLDGLRVHVKKEMTREPPRRIARLTTRLTIPRATSAGISATDRADLETTAHQCPVRLSLLPAIEVPVEFDWEA